MAFTTKRNWFQFCFYNHKQYTTKERVGNLSYSSSDTTCFWQYLTNHHKSLWLMVIKFLSLQSITMSAKIAINLTHLILSNVFSNLHSKHIIHCCFLNFFHTSRSMPLLHHVYHILSWSHIDLAQENHLHLIRDIMSKFSAKCLRHEWLN